MAVEWKFPCLYSIHPQLIKVMCFSIYTKHIKPKYFLSCHRSRFWRLLDIGTVGEAIKKAQVILLFLWINAVDFAQWEAACCVKGKRVLQECILNSLVSGHMRFEPDQVVLHSNPRMSHFAMFTSDNYQLQTSSNTCSNQPPLEAEFFLREVIHQNSEHSLSVYTQELYLFLFNSKNILLLFLQAKESYKVMIWASCSLHVTYQ